MGKKLGEEDDDDDDEPAKPGAAKAPVQTAPSRPGASRPNRGKDAEKMNAAASEAVASRPPARPPARPAAKTGFVSGGAREDEDEDERTPLKPSSAVKVIDDGSDDDEIQKMDTKDAATRAPLSPPSPAARGALRGAVDALFIGGG